MSLLNWTDQKVEQNDCLVKVGKLTCGKSSHELVFQGCKVESDENMVHSVLSLVTMTSRIF